MDAKKMDAHLAFLGRLLKPMGTRYRAPWISEACASGLLGCWGEDSSLTWLSAPGFLDTNSQTCHSHVISNGGMGSY